jgi:hypothetical protein
MCGSAILRLGGIMRRLNIDVCVSREGLIVMGDVLGGMRSIDRTEWHRTARQLVDQGLLRPLGDVCYYQLTEVGRAVLAALGR